MNTPRQSCANPTFTATVLDGGIEVLLQLQSHVVRVSLHELHYLFVGAVGNIVPVDLHCAGESKIIDVSTCECVNVCSCVRV